MRRVLLTIICAVGIVWSASAQPQSDQAKYELIRETINFLAADKTVSQDTSFRISCETMDYDCFKQQLAGSPIAGIDRWYNSWRSMKAADEKQLLALKNQIFADIFDRPGKGYRKQLAGYQGYVARVEQLLAPDAAEVPMDEVPMDTAPIAAADEMQTITHAQLTDQIDNPEKEDTMIAYFAIAIGLIALVLAALPFLKQKEQQQVPVDFQGLQDRLDELAIRMKRLENKIGDSQVKDEAIISLTEIMEAVEKRVVELESGSKSDMDF